MNRALHAFVVAATLGSATFALAQQPDAAAPAAPTTSDNPSVQALLDSKPSSPDDLFNVITLLLELKEPLFAKPLLAKLDQTATDDAQLNALGRKYGSRAVSRLAEVPELQPEGKAFAEKVRTAMSNTARDPARIAALIEQLKDPALDIRVAAINNLRLGGDTATQLLVETIFRAQTPADRHAAEVGLAGMGEHAVGPLAAMLTSGDDVATTSAATTLALIDDASALNDLYVAAFAPSLPAAVRARAEAALTHRFNKAVKPVEAAGRLYLTAEGLYKKKPSELDPPPTTTSWHWDAESKRPVQAVVPARLDELRRAARYARAANDISGGDAVIRRLSQGAAFEAMIWEATDPAQLNASVAAWAAAEKLTRADYEALYEQAAANDRILAAARWLGLLAASAPADQLLTSVGGRPTALVRAASHPDSTIRFAAVAAIMKQAPTQSFPGSSGVADALAYFATGEGVDRTLVVDPRLGRGRDLAGMLVELNVRAEATDDVRDALLAAVNEADMRLILVDQTLLNPAQGNFLARLRADFRTARLPVIVLAEPEDVSRLRTRLYADPYTLVFIRPATPEHLKTQLALNPPPGSAVVVEGPERLRRAQLALASLRQLLETKNSVFNVRPYEQNLLKAAVSPSLAKSAVGALAYFGSAAAQRTLIETASAHVRPLDVRQAAASAFCENVIRHGTLLTTDEIQKQYAAYNASESLDRPTQELLGAILDAIEARAAKVPSPFVKPTKSAAAAAVAPPSP